MPEFNPRRILGPAPEPLHVAPAQTLGYFAYLNFGGLILSVSAPCGCQVHLDTSEVQDLSNGSCLEPCGKDLCVFEWAEALTSAKHLLEAK
jgi:hypothetical protein